MGLGLYTFGDIVADPHTGFKPSPTERMAQMLELAKLAEEAGLDIIGVGEHHGLDYINSATATIIAAMAAVTKRIRFTSASTLLSTADPVRTFQEFSTADLVSKGRVEIIFGRGALTDNFPLFGLDLKNYEALFIEKLNLFAELNGKERVTWSGQFRSALRDAEIAPRPSQVRFPVSIGAGSPGSVVRAAQLGYPLTMPVLGGSFAGYAQMAGLYRQALGGERTRSRRRQGRDLRPSACDRDRSRDPAGFLPLLLGLPPADVQGPMPPTTFAQMLSPQGTLMGGSVQQVIDKILILKHEVGS